MLRSSHRHIGALGVAVFGLCWLGHDRKEALLEKKDKNILRSLTNTKKVSRFKKPHACSSINAFSPGCSELRVFAGSAHQGLACDIATALGSELGKASVKRFADKEVSVKIEESVRGKDVYVVQPTSPHVNEHLVELLLMVSALRNASAKRVTVVIPYFGYMRSLADSVSAKRKDWNYHRSNLAASSVAKMIEVSGAQRVIAVDMYPPGMGMAEGFFYIPIEHLKSSDMIVDELVASLRLKEKNFMDDELVVVSPHASCLTKAKLFKDELHRILNVSIGLATIIRTPPPEVSSNHQGPKPVTKFDLVGKVEGKTVLIIEDIIDSGTTTLQAVKALRDAGAKDVMAFASHAILSEDAPERLQNADIQKIVTLNTIPVSQEKHERIPKMDQLSIAPMVADLISHMHYEAK